MNWVKNNKILTLLIIGGVLYFFGRNFFGVSTRSLSLQKSYSSSSYGVSSGAGLSNISSGSVGVSDMAEMIAPAVPRDTVNTSGSPSSDRVVINESYMSIVVKDVRDTGEKVISYANDNGGFMVNSNYSQPEEAPFATITVRVSSDKFEQALDYFRSLGVKVVNENVVGKDVTEQYTNIEERINTLTKTKTKFEQLLDQATEVQDILQINQQLLSIDSQIDYWIGQRKAIEQNANLTKITVYLSTDEFSLPYVPNEKFRPNVIFKLAVRSLVSSFRDIAGWAIWIAVYSVIWLPIVLIFLGYKRYKNRKTPKV
jgi:hypothetical protein